MKTVRRVFRLASVLATVLAALLLVVAAAAGPRAADSGGRGDGVADAANALRNGPVYVDPKARDVLPPSAADVLGNKIERADKPVLVAVLPAGGGFDRHTLLRDLRTETGITGVYAVALGNRFDAGADHQVMPRDAVRNVVGAVQRAHPGDPRAMVGDFVGQALRQADGVAPAAWHDGGTGQDGGRTGGGTTAIVTLGVLVLLAAGGAFLISMGGRRRQERQDRAGLERLRPVVDEDITAFGEELGRIGFDPTTAAGRVGREQADAAREDYARALDAYEDAKAAMGKARRPQDVRRVSEALGEGRFALATLDARLGGKPLPERRPPCFFDPRHGPSVEDVQWTPPGATERTVPVCAADAARLADGDEPPAREVGTPQGPRPYWEAGPVYAPWAAGYFGGALLPGLLMGTMLGNALGGGYAYGADGYGGPGDGDFGGGDFSGGDFDARDFGGGFGDGGGGFGGGDFGGGF
ncbi:hypothetical protein ITI46_18545 [Streptomyces oryzae]|uniref:TPM domain-containing protein n=1 Tax=Streptomyces oryzae TaxID=1434886 RepID=A0ABS3XEC7_9ACTN|nr:hypothetical protein [Streptomyces oryzae]MBO8193644.1 hypothetical protein [Streptomyces oryzae]